MRTRGRSTILGKAGDPDATPTRGGRVPVLGGDSGLGALIPATELALEAGKVLAQASCLPSQSLYLF